MTLRAIRETKLLQFVGHGAEGDTLLAILEQVVSPSNLLTVRTKGKCRTCITLIDQSSNKSTELIEPSDNISEMEVIELLQLADAVCNKLSNDINENNIEAAKVAGLAIMGSLPPGVSTDTYAQIVSRVCDCNSRIILDTVVGLPRTLEQCMLTGCHTLLKVNRAELSKLVGMSHAKETVVVVEQLATKEHILNLVEAFIAAYLPDLACASRSKMHFAITDGPRPVHLVTAGNLHRLTLKHDHIHVVNPIGAGDSVAAGVLQCWTGNVDLEGLEAEEGSLLRAVMWGMACGAASCATVENSRLEMSLAKEYFSHIHID
eukprot:gene34784-42121_t